MKYKKLKNFILSILLLMLPITVSAASYNGVKVSSKLNLDNLFQLGAVVNDTSNANNLNIIIIGMVIVILVLVGAAMFTTKK